MNRKILALLALFFLPGAYADNTLRVGFIATSTVSSGELAEFRDWIPFFEQTWANTPAPGKVLQLWRGGENVFVGNVLIPQLNFNLGLGNLSINSTVQKAYSTVGTASIPAPYQFLQSYRNSINADVLVVIVGNVSTSGGLTCGATRNPANSFASGFFSPNPNTQGLDVSNAESDFMIVITDHCLNSVISDNIQLAHEFSHIFGGTHAKTVAQGDSTQGVLPPNRANAYTHPTIPSILATPGASASQDAGVSQFSFPQKKYSSNGMLSGDYFHSNWEALVLTGPSVASYRPRISNADLPPMPTPPIVSSCGLSTPEFLTAYKINFCATAQNGALVTTYRLDWYDFCRGASDFYEIWATQPSRGTYYVGPAATNSSPIAVFGESGTVKVRACSVGGGCSGFSESEFVSYDC